MHVHMLKYLQNPQNYHVNHYYLYKYLKKKVWGMACPLYSPRHSFTKPILLYSLSQDIYSWSIFNKNTGTHSCKRSAIKIDERENFP